jgi:hypothetical protein
VGRFDGTGCAVVVILSLPMTALDEKADDVTGCIGLLTE